MTREQVIKEFEDRFPEVYFPPEMTRDEVEQFILQALSQQEEEYEAEKSLREVCEEALEIQEADLKAQIIKICEGKKKPDYDCSCDGGCTVGCNDSFNSALECIKAEVEKL